MKSLTKPIIIVVAATAIGTAVGGYVWHNNQRPHILEIHVFSLSSGRSMFIRTPGDKRILVDGGGNSEVIRKLTEIIPFYSRRIDAVVATNTEGKNVSGLIDVMERYDIGQVYIPGQTLETLGLATSSDRIYETFLETAQKRALPLQEVMAGMDISPDSKISIKALFPADRADFAYSKASGPELLIQISFENNSAIFLGNASPKVQKFLASSTVSYSFIGYTNILIVSHSALPANMSEKLVSIIKPERLIYSKTLSSQPPKPPQPTNSKTKKKEVVDPLAYLAAADKLNIKEKGTLKVTSDGVQIQVENIR